MQAELVLKGGVVVGRIDTRVYRLNAIKKAAYRFADRCTVMFGSLVGDHLEVTLRSKAAWTEADGADVIRAFTQELLDQELREQVSEETAPLRTLILAQAFSKSGLIRDE